MQKHTTRTRLLLLAAVAAITFVPRAGRSQQAGVAPAREAQTPRDAAAGLVHDLRWRGIGPANMSGRVSDIEALDGRFATVLVAAASGGVWKSTNAGTTWTPIFDRYGSASIGDVAFFQKDPDIIWIGTGESCVRNSVAWGDGVYKSTDGGKTFTNVGLRDTHHIAEVVTHPTDPNIVYVAAQGHLWAHAGERGVFKTIDGGKTWQRLTAGLPDDGKTGASDLRMDPKNPNVLYAAFWERLRQPHRFDSGGPNGGIFKTVDAGRTWKKLTSGLPAGQTGKIGLAISRQNPNVLVAIVEHEYQPRPRTADGKSNPEYGDMTKLGSGIYRTEDAGATWKYINRYNNRPFYYSHIYIHPLDDTRVYVLAGSAQVSEDGGRTFARSLGGVSGDFHAMWIDPTTKDRFYIGNDKGAYATYDHGASFVMFDNMGIGQFYSVTLDSRDPYWVYGGLQDNGNWGGPSNSRDWNGILNDHWYKFHSGDGFHTTVDPNDWRLVYTESQGGNIRRLDAMFRQMGKSITPTPQTIVNYRDYVADARTDDRSARLPPDQDSRGVRLPPDQDSRSARLPPDQDSRGVRLQPDLPARLPSPRFRFNWSAALALSPHDSRIVYLGGNHLFKSVDRGDTWQIVSPDLSANEPAKANPEGNGGLTRENSGAETHCTIVTMSESPLARGVIWVGTDDGNVQLTRNGGQSWTNVRANVPEAPAGLWVSRVTASRFAEGTAYVAFDGHRSDEFRPWIFRTADFGTTWTKLVDGIPSREPVYVLTEDYKNPRLLFAGTEFAAYVSINGGRHWQRLMSDLPTVAVHDLVIHPRDNDLVAATHGRSFWILDDITPLQQLTDDVLSADAHLFQNRVATIWRGVTRGATRGHFLFAGRNPLTIDQRPPGNSPPELSNSAAIHYYLKDRASGPVTIEIVAASSQADVGRVFRPADDRGVRPPPDPQKHTATLPGDPGLHRYYWNLRYDLTPEQKKEQQARAQPQPAPGAEEEGGPGAREILGAPAGPGTYVVKLTVGAKTYTTLLTVRDDPALRMTSGSMNH